MGAEPQRERLQPAWAEEVHRISHEEYPEDGDSRIYTGGWRYWNVFDMGVGTPQANVIGDAATYSDKPVIVSEYGDWNYGGYTSTTRVTREPAHTKFNGGDEGMLIQCDNLQESMALNAARSGAAPMPIGSTPTMQGLIPRTSPTAALWTSTASRSSAHTLCRASATRIST